MKKNLFIIITLCSIILYTACSKKNAETSNNEKHQDTNQAITSEAITSEIGTIKCHEDIESISKLNIPTSIKSVFTEDGPLMPIS